MRPTYTLKPRPTQIDPYAKPDEWALMKGQTTLQTFDSKRAGSSRAKEVAKNQKATLAIYDAAMKTSDEFDYRSEEEKRKAGKDRLNRQVRSGLGSNFSL